MTTLEQARARFSEPGSDDERAKEVEGAKPLSKVGTVAARMSFDCSSYTAELRRIAAIIDMYGKGCKRAKKGKK